MNKTESSVNKCGPDGFDLNQKQSGISALLTSQIGMASNELRDQAEADQAQSGGFSLLIDQSRDPSRETMKAPEALYGRFGENSLLTTRGVFRLTPDYVLLEDQALNDLGAVDF